MTARPSIQPITSLTPSAGPSFTGLVALFATSKSVTNDLSETQIDDITAEVMEQFNVTQDQLETTRNMFLVHDSL